MAMSVQEDAEFADLKIRVRHLELLFMEPRLQTTEMQFCRTGEESDAERARVARAVEARCRWREELTRVEDYMARRGLCVW